ncbi:hypothetical protein Hypma_012243 [Hypsizygus marmoreus]|uniref:Uncharacterized protein n=1 Tax=Hypsizygus marmoreus TaxID=39966 RepID=A0A369JLT6_HYPMA|nr:hypothetical protein Hypma_012243 [Hypsizygus marmoreus]
MMRDPELAKLLQETETRPAASGQLGASIRPHLFIGRRVPSYAGFCHGLSPQEQIEDAAVLGNLLTHIQVEEEQEARDASMRSAMEVELQNDGSNRDVKNNANLWADRTRTMAQFDYDTDLEVEKWWAAGRQKNVVVATEEVLLPPYPLSEEQLPSQVVSHAGDIKIGSSLAGPAATPGTPGKLFLLFIMQLPEG